MEKVTYLLRGEDLLNFCREYFKDDAGVTTARGFWESMMGGGVVEHRVPELTDVEKAFAKLADEGVLERVGRNGFQVEEMWLEGQGIDINDLLEGM